MDESVRRSRSRSFGSVADVYERSRPGYPAEAVRWLLADHVSSYPGSAPDGRPPGSAFDSYAVVVDDGYQDGTSRYDGSPHDTQHAGATPVDEPATVVELAAGTGKLTTSLVADRHRVIAVEPAASMLARLVRHVPYALPVQAVAEKIPLVASSADAVVVAQAFHWFDTEAALAEIARVLRPGGTLGLVWNYRDESVPWVRQLSSLLAAAERIEARQAEELIETLEWSRLFEPPEYSGFRLWQKLDRDGLLHLVASRSYVAHLPPAERQEVLHHVGELYDMTARQPDGLVMPYVTTCFRTRVRKR
ncbi:class I SAM-dependent methyltransferase [Actinopolymorpha alba]|uniref:class I SAM-dependent methyltransferase n=1 Tax=Actinopolymorpha alba TaxID=533267 RepID=UPI0003770AAD|nr:class I SAM-dependent methyltransferase [Actinopolymorpha alba]